ncbi:MAG TPA: prepilin-type N-terminal cleavage/methylation domain-containing protein [Candidatus Sumerlaeota bacterium]|nr:prepilin-type N-terminal cleavage/methylation domain-containing protein [Candidatus Sumerlaeota bacterium]HON50986.1 prepilin-type N-terminal cleavage/methylation domain-containing protein [Candidatus Sumerlaeota bacterium]HOR65758.1 prepilin-type N-terminal cleavage/methylation domain-containing protein [Candidatus Sumerlaeota bacterium]HPL75514.1 prepilin-type N-terminal cleavage/methylation domain-containing protein [Candidatus Sumerlaeota bacterium]HRU55112.1 prepilin-type N-terminal cle
MFRRFKGFTLIELLIVVAIIAILAAIAVPNFLEAQIRSKVSRAKADMRSVATALESYFTDNNHYPNHSENGWPYYITRQITTPMAYMTSVAFHDPFKTSGHASQLATDYPRRFRYFNVEAGANDWPDIGPLYVGHKYGVLNVVNIRARYGEWKIISAGPDKKENTGVLDDTLIYDPTNGTSSLGDICRSQKSSNVERSRD